jgi:hypothetical protein
VHLNESKKIGYDLGMFQKFCKMKQEAFNTSREFYVNIRTNEGDKLIQHMSESPSLVKVAHDKAIYIGGIAVHPKRHILQFEYDVGNTSLNKVNPT